VVDGKFVFALISGGENFTLDQNRMKIQQDARGGKAYCHLALNLHSSYDCIMPLATSKAAIMMPPPGPRRSTWCSQIIGTTHDAS
jgi:hypothetical protein